MDDITKPRDLVLQDGTYSVPIELIIINLIKGLTV